MKKTELGAWGEDRAAALLEQEGYRIRARNFRCRFGEIDLIAEKENILAFVEVKLRKSDRFARAAEFVDYRKQARLRTTAELWLSQCESELPARFDVLEIYAPEGEQTKNPIIYHLEDAFQ